jgi:hypothetical protein
MKQNECDNFRIHGMTFATTTFFSVREILKLFFMIEAQRVLAVVSDGCLRPSPTLTETGAGGFPPSFSQSKRQ